MILLPNTKCTWHHSSNTSKIYVAIAITCKSDIIRTCNFFWGDFFWLLGIDVYACNYPVASFTLSLVV